MKLVLYFLEKYFHSPRQQWRRSGSIFMILGIVISVATLTIAFTIFDGYQRVLKKTILSTNSHVYIFSNSRNALYKSDIQFLQRYLEKQPEVTAVGGVIISQAMASASRKGNNKVISCQLRGIEWEKPDLPITYREYVREGSWRLESVDDVVIGDQLAKRLGVEAGDEINLVNPAQNKMSLMGLKSQIRRYQVKGIYYSGNYEADSRTIFMHPEQAWEFSQQPGKYTRFEVKLKPSEIERADYLSYRWFNELNLNYQILTWQDFNSALFNLLELEKWVLFFILSFLIVVASFNVISSVSTEIIDRKRDIGILKTMGFSNKHLRNILLGRILSTGLIAIILGELLGMLLSWIASVQEFFKLKGDVYFLDRINVYFSPPAMILILITAIVIIYLAAAIPLRKLNKLEITSILRS